MCLQSSSRLGVVGCRVQLGRDRYGVYCRMHLAPDFSLLESLLQTIRGKKATRQNNGLLMIIDPIDAS